MENFILIFVCIIAGYLFKMIPSVPTNIHTSLNFFIIHVSLPSVLLLYLPRLQFSIDTLIPLLAGWFIFGLAFLFFKAVGYILTIDKNTVACLTLVCGLGNTSFLGFPLIEAYYGKEYLNTAILMDQGTFLALSSLGLFTAMYYSEQESETKTILKKILRSPQTIAFMIALIIANTGYPFFMEEVLGKLAATLVPLALFSIGLQLKFDFKSISFRNLLLGFFFKLFLAPLLVFWGCLLFSHHLTMDSKVVVIEAAMPPMMMASVLAGTYQLNPSLAQLLTSIGIGLAFITTWLWVLFLG